MAEVTRFDDFASAFRLPQREARAVGALTAHVALADARYFASVRILIGSEDIPISQTGPAFTTLFAVTRNALVDQLPVSASGWQLSREHPERSLAELVVNAITDLRDERLVDLAEDGIPDCLNAAQAVLTMAPRYVLSAPRVDEFTMAEAAVAALLDAMELYLLSRVLS